MFAEQQRAGQVDGERAATHLAREFDGTFGAETIERSPHTSYDDLAGRAVVLDFLPLLAEEFARQRLRALARVEGRAQGKGIDVRPVRDEIERRVRRLLVWLDVPVAG
jgi:hypothetical protein